MGNLDAIAVSIQDVQMTNLPPQILETEEVLRRAIGLLARRIDSSLTRVERAELKTLLGKYPTPAQANAWRQALRRKLEAPRISGIDEEV